ncbi:MAG TPA: helix-turn-helix domain-containing protein [Burkholderiales bacterium]|nr:helix-turn-helix domain-containing protein [Burkholderiales bacterium]
MPNVGALLKEEITRLSRKEIRRQLAGVKKASAQYRRHIAALRRRIAGLERQVTVLGTRGLGREATAAAQSTRRTRFVAKGLHSHRTRLGLSAEEYGRLVGVSAQTIYSWERRESAPRAEQRASLATVRGLGKREARARLEAVTSRGEKRTRRARR